MDRYACPCCGNLSLDEEPPGTRLVCDVCWWEDDPVQSADAEYRSGANGPSPNEAREYFRTIGVSAPEHLARVRREDPSRLPK
jgi:hypothetical protein